MIDDRETYSGSEVDLHSAIAEHVGISTFLNLSIILALAQCPMSILFFLVFGEAVNDYIFFFIIPWAVFSYLVVPVRYALYFSRMGHGRIMVKVLSVFCGVFWPFAPLYFHRSSRNQLIRRGVTTEQLKKALPKFVFYY